jgi:hypothetical protein
MKVSDRVAVTSTPTYSIIHDTCEAGKRPCRVICKKQGLKLAQKGSSGVLRGRVEL